VPHSSFAWGGLHHFLRRRRLGAIAVRSVAARRRIQRLSGDRGGVCFAAASSDHRRRVGDRGKFSFRGVLGARLLCTRTQIVRFGTLGQEVEQRRHNPAVLKFERGHVRRARDLAKFRQALASGGCVLKKRGS